MLDLSIKGFKNLGYKRLGQTFEILKLSYNSMSIEIQWCDILSGGRLVVAAPGVIFRNSAWHF